MTGHQIKDYNDVALRAPKKILIALPPAMLQQVDVIAGAEHRTRSDLVREALRRYIAGFQRERITLVSTEETACV